MEMNAGGGRGRGGGGSDPPSKGCIMKRSEIKKETSAAMIQVISEIEELGLGNEEEEDEEGKQQRLAPPDNSRELSIEEEEMVYVVISGESNSNSSMDALLWTLNNAAAAAANSSSSSNTPLVVFLVHVFPEIRFIPTPLGKLPISQANPEQKEILMEQERTKRREYLLKYLHLCSSSKVD